MENKNKWIFGIALFDGDVEDYKEYMKKEYDLSDEQIAKLKMAHLFRLSDNVRYHTFDADIVLYDEDGETYYHTGDFEPINTVKVTDTVAVCSDEGECKNV